MATVHQVQAGRLSQVVLYFCDGLSQFSVLRILFLKQQNYFEDTSQSVLLTSLLTVLSMLSNIDMCAF